MTTLTRGSLDARAGTGARRVADLLCLAAAPACAVMAVLTAIPEGAHAMLCGGMPDAPAPGGMTGMYMLMSVFHSAPWLRLIAGGR